MLREAGDDFVVCEIIVIIMVVADIEETVAFQTERLMYLEIETDILHILMVVCVDVFQFLAAITFS